jgi:integrase
MIGQFINAVDSIRRTSDRTHYDSCAKLRRIAGEIFGIAQVGNGAAAAAKWRRKVEVLKLSKISPIDIEKWRIKKLASAKTQIQRAKTETTADSVIRCAKALFKPQNLVLLDKLDLQSPLPFEGLRTKQHLKKYVSKIDGTVLLKNAQAGLSAELLKIFMLAFGAGLRRGEIDHLRWSMINSKQGVIALEETNNWKPKTSESKHPFPISWEVLEVLGQPNDGFVICPKKPKERVLPESYPQGYRCDHEFKKLNEWLRKQGVDTQCPIHTLRKEFGSMVSSEYGIEVAAKQLRHKTITLTFAVYQDYNTTERLDLSNRKLKKASIA